MTYLAMLLLSACSIVSLSVFFVVAPRLRMERRPRALLAAHPDAEQTSVYLALHSAFAGGKRREIDAKIAEMQPQGWSFLRGSEANPLRTSFTRGGGLTLHFLRTTV
ncbi:MAG: hypothetical protein JNL18_08815 [Planctomycetaceae bacterium]|nr:hypothetical protein [Planctomycetaceae bacterium]